jgi:cytochrome c oxidase subunit IV
MATETETETDTTDTAPGEHPETTSHGTEIVHHDHPNDAQYWKIFFILLAITAVEVLLYYFSIPGVNINNAALGGLAIAKFIVVVAYFMHLKFDNKILRRLFVGGLLLAVAVYIAYLLSMGVFIEDPDKRNQAPQNQAWAGVRAS